MNISIIQADYCNTRHASDMSSLLAAYALDPMGGGQPLEQRVISSLASELAKIPQAFSILCYVDERAAGLINCFQSFSTFKCKPIINVHDIVVAKEYRGLGLCQRMLNLTEEVARERGCCKITLEVLEGNSAAQSAYRKFGFSGYQLDPNMGKALFWEKALNN